MCIGMPMQVRDVMPGHAWCEGRGERRRVNTALVGPVAHGDWLLVFLDSARERIDARRADEVNAALDLVESAIQGLAPTTGEPAFALPSAMDARQVAALAGTPIPD